MRFSVHCDDSLADSDSEQAAGLFQKKIHTFVVRTGSQICGSLICGTHICEPRVLTIIDFGTKSNITRIKAALIKKELIDIENGKVVVPDPVFRLWLLKFVR